MTGAQAFDGWSDIGAAQRDIATRLAQAGLDTPAREARLLLEGALRRRDVAALDRARPFSVGEQARVRDHLARRLGGEPVFRILGEREFWGLPFALSPATLEPRPDSETLVEAALAVLRPRRHEPLRLIDLGTGTGCLLIALLSELPGATGLGIDLAEPACTTARGNALRNGLSARAAFRQGDWGNGIAERFDLVISNPPYIATAEIAQLAPEVRLYDPALALDGGSDGLDAYRALARQVPALLAPAGVAVLEAGAGQADAIAAVMCAAGLIPRERRCDLGGHERALVFGRPCAGSGR